MKLKLDMHEIYNRGEEVDRALRAVINEAVAKKAPLVAIIPGKGSGALKKHVVAVLARPQPALPGVRPRCTGREYRRAADRS